MHTTAPEKSQEKMLKVSIRRGVDDGAFVDYEAPMRANQTVLDIVTEVQRPRGGL